MTPAGLARRYARALVEAAGRDPAGLDRLAEACAELGRALAAPDVVAALADPTRRSQDLAAAVARALPASTPRPLRGLVETLARRRRLGALPDVLREAGALIDGARGIAAAEITTAVEVPAEIRPALEAAVGRAAGAAVKKVRATYRVDPALIGGVVARVGDRRLDASVAGHLRRFREAATG